MNFLMKILSLFTLSGFDALTKGNIIMLLVGGVLLYLAIAKKFEPLLLLTARVVQKVGQEANPKNFLLMHAMGPNKLSTLH
jgi:Na+-transporting methylmalonyl-CoA/oxaloacetate decarboxylase beta subunit